MIYNYSCFQCGRVFSLEHEPNIDFTNTYGEWHGVVCECGGKAKHIGHKLGVYMPVELFFSDGKNRKISKAHLTDIRSRAVTPDGTVLRGREGLKYNYSKGMKMGNLDAI